MSNQPNRFKTLSEARMTNDGSMVTLNIETHETHPFTLTLPPGELVSVIQYLARLLGAAATLRPKTDQLNRPIQSEPIKADAVGYAPGSLPQTVELVIGMGDLDLSFLLPSSALRTLQASLAQVIQIAEMEPKRPQ